MSKLEPKDSRGLLIRDIVVPQLRPGTLQGDRPPQLTCWAVVHCQPERRVCTGGLVLPLVQEATAPRHFLPITLVLHCTWKSELR